MEESKIEWTTHTFNPWWGCMKISPGCKFCYADQLDNRYHHENRHWGLNSERKPMSVAYWKNPFKWNKAAELAGVKAMVFCASMADVFEGQDTIKHYPSWLMVQDARIELFQVIATTPNLIWQLLTKRPDNIRSILGSIHGPLEMHDFLDEEDGANKEYLEKHKEAYHLLSEWLNDKPPENVWLGTSVENQEVADLRIPQLVSMPAKVRFLSCEPLLEMVTLNSLKYVKWIIIGGESGNDNNIRPMLSHYAYYIQSQGFYAGIPIFFKQWGEWVEFDQMPKELQLSVKRGETNHKIVNFKEGDLTHTLHKVGKHLSGSILNGIEYKEFPIN